MNKNIQMECLEEELKFSFNNQLVTMKKGDKMTLPHEIAKPYCDAGLAKDSSGAIKTGTRTPGVVAVDIADIAQDSI